MGQTPETTNQTAVNVDNAIDSAVSGVIPLVESAIIADEPILGLPIVKQIFEFVLKEAGDKFEIYLGNDATFMIIDLQTYQELKLNQKTLAAIQAALNTGQKDAIQKAVQDNLPALSSLIHFDGST